MVAETLDLVCEVLIANRLDRILNEGIFVPAMFVQKTWTAIQQLAEREDVGNQ